MRFLANGPSIPDELLLARDQGRVVFFCGAGVSRAKANLPDFFDLAERVTNHLGVQENNPASKLLSVARALGAQTGIDGLISADRIFGLLERDFLVRDIEAAVAIALKPKPNPDLQAHQTLIKLATTREGLVRLVTTNFDRLFDHCNPIPPSFRPPRLPDPSCPSELNGVVYLHGKVTADYSGAEGDGFVLSSSEFGKAYLSDGWATSFFREIIDRYVVAFVGYAADDPPVHYLLEALNKTAGKLEGVYAFQSGNTNYANSKWQHKGVEAIPYDEVNHHIALWDTLEAWANRAIDPDGWISSIVNKAKQGPEKLQPHERGQVAHVVSTVEGLRQFSADDSPPPATWLCVFDPFRRYAKPEKSRLNEDERILVDPFNFYGLDSDVIPQKVDPEGLNSDREVPKGVWDAFVLNKIDRQNLRDENYGSLRGPWAANVPRLPSRLSQMGVWITKVANQPATVWWAARQNALHPDLREQISWELERPQKITQETIRSAWRYLFDYWAEDHGDFDRDWYKIGADLALEGWNELTLRRFAKCARPYLKAEQNFWGGPTPPALTDQLKRHDLLRLDVEYPGPPNNFKIPDNWLCRAIIHVRRNLETAIELENEIGGYGLNNISPINPESDPENDRHGRSHGLSGWVIYFSSLFERLLTIDSDAAKAEFTKWATDDETIFARLRMWGAGKSELVSGEEFGLVIASISRDAFWDSFHARDLLLTLKSRWNGLSAETRGIIEQRILQGPLKRESEEDEAFRKRKSWSIINVIKWMESKGCKFILDIHATTNQLRIEIPDWEPKFAERADRSLESRVGWVKTELEHSVLLKEPLENTLSRALELAGRKVGVEFVEYDPFAGLSSDHPVRAFAALRMAAKKNNFPEWAWRTFLSSEGRKSDKLKFSRFIAECITRFSVADVAKFIRAAAEWCRLSARTLSNENPELFSKLVNKLVNALAHDSTIGTSSIIRGNKAPDWTMEAINSPTGYLAEALFEDPRKNNLKAGNGFPDSWLCHVDLLLDLPGDLRRHALVIFTHNLSWFFAIDPNWTRLHLLSILDGKDEEDKQSFWAGFLWGGKAQGYQLFLALKPHLLQMAKSNVLERRGQTQVVAGLLLSAWGLGEHEPGKYWVTSDELRDVLIHSGDDLRSHILWQGERWSNEKDDGNDQKWPSLLLALLRDVWPRQITAKSAIVSARLCDLAFSNAKRFPEMAELILPLVSKSDRDHLNLPNLQRSKDNIVDLYPSQSLALLHAVLPDNVAAWPYGIGETLTRIGQSSSSLANDERLLELRRKWDAR